MYNRVIIVLNDVKSIRTLLAQRAQIYSDRPMSWMYNVICARGQSVFNISASNARHKIYRRLLQWGLGKQATKQAFETMIREMEILLDGLTEEPGQWRQHIRRYVALCQVATTSDTDSHLRQVAAVILRVGFGYDINSLDDPFIQAAEETSKISGWATAPGRWLVDYFPLRECSSLRNSLQSSNASYFQFGLYLPSSHWLLGNVKV